MYYTVYLHDTNGTYLGAYHFGYHCACLLRGKFFLCLELGIIALACYNICCFVTEHSPLHTHLHTNQNLYLIGVFSTMKYALNLG